MFSLLDVIILLFNEIIKQNEMITSLESGCVYQRGASNTYFNGIDGAFVR